MEQSPYIHKQLELKAICVKIEKLSQWISMYRAGKIQAKSSAQVAATMILLHEAETEKHNLFNKQ